MKVAIAPINDVYIRRPKFKPTRKRSRGFRSLKVHKYIVLRARLSGGVVT